MKKLIIIGSVLLFLIGSMSSCERAIEQNIGNTFVLMSRNNITISFVDTLKISGVDTLYNTLKDTTINSIGVYRSGLSSSYPEINVTLKIDSLYLKSMIQQANDPLVPDVQKSSTVLNFKGSILLPASCYQFTKTAKVEGNQMVGDVSLVVNRSKFAKLRTAKIFLPIAIDTLATSGVNTAKAISIVQIKNAFIYKKQ
ncbi:MAG: hypothetical protein WCP85_24170 [Mariniphaga sp.]